MENIKDIHHRAFAGNKCNSY